MLQDHKYRKRREREREIRSCCLLLLSYTLNKPDLFIHYIWSKHLISGLFLRYTRGCLLLFYNSCMFFSFRWLCCLRTAASVQNVLEKVLRRERSTPVCVRLHCSDFCLVSSHPGPGRTRWTEGRVRISRTTGQLLIKHINLRMHTQYTVYNNCH